LNFFFDRNGSQWLVSKYTETVHVEFSSLCNLKCVFCYASQPEYKGQFLRKEILEPLIRSLTSRKPKIVSVNGHGETTIYPNWHQYCDHMINDNLHLHIITNFAKKFNDEELHTLAHFESIEISCDTADPDLFRHLRRGAELPTILENIKRLRASIAAIGVTGPKISFSCVVSDQTIFGLKDLVSMGASLGVNGFNFCNFVQYPPITDGINLNHISQLPRGEMVRARESIEIATALLKESQIRFQIQQGLLDSLEQKLAAEPEPPKRISSDCSISTLPEKTEAESKTPFHHRRFAASVHKKETRNCLDPWSFLLVDAHGDVLPCCWHHPIGSLADGKTQFHQVRNSRQVKELRRSLLTGDLHADCQSCPSRGLTTIRNLKKRVSRYLHPYSARLTTIFKPKIAPALTEMPIEFISGWYDRETDPNFPDPAWSEWRWTSKMARFRFTPTETAVSLIVTGLADPSILSDQQITIRINGRELERFFPAKGKFIREYFLDKETIDDCDSLLGEIEVDRTFVPSEHNNYSEDHRHLGVRIYRLSIGV